MDRKKILVAPSWGKRGLLETKGQELVKILLDADYHVISQTTSYDNS